MKTTSILSVKMLVLLIGFTAMGLGSSMADWQHHDAWSHDNHGYWDDHASYHPFVVYHEHRGYWRERNGVRLFINID